MTELTVRKATAALDEPNPDPWTGRRIADVEGRSDDLFIYRSIKVHPHLFRSAFSRRREIVEYQVRQTTSGADVTLRTVSPLDIDALARELVEDLAGLGLDSPAVTVVVVEEIPRPSTAAKLRTFVPLTTGSARSSTTT